MSPGRGRPARWTSSWEGAAAGVAPEARRRRGSRAKAGPRRRPGRPPTRRRVPRRRTPSRRPRSRAWSPWRRAPSGRTRRTTGRARSRSRRSRRRGAAPPPRRALEKRREAPLSRSSPGSLNAPPPPGDENRGSCHKSVWTKQPSGGELAGSGATRRCFPNAT